MEGVGRSSDANPFTQIVEAGLKRFGKIDAATMFSGRVVTGRFMDSSTDDLKE